MVLPSLYFELPDTQRVGDELGSPTVVARVGHSGLDPSSRPGLSVSEQGADRVVAVAEDTSASIVTGSPTTLFAANRPPSTWGDSASITTRPIVAGIFAMRRI